MAAHRTCNAVLTDEDSVTGSAHCCLADFWRRGLGKTEFVAYQVSARGGVVRVRVVKDRALLGGRAVTVARGEASCLWSGTEYETIARFSAHPDHLPLGDDA
jgi:predicted PhzF superfamily epimerase YddE/YHI9